MCDKKDGRKRLHEGQVDHVDLPESENTLTERATFDEGADVSEQGPRN